MSTGKQTAAPKPTASAATTQEITEKLKGADISTPVQEIARMFEKGTDPDVIRAYVENSSIAFNPTASEIIYLHERGVPGPILTAMIERSAKLREQMAVASASQPAQAAPAAPAQSTAPTYAAPASQPVYVYSSYPNYTYPNVTYIPYTGYNYYSGYNYCYSPYYYSSYYSRPYFGLSYSFGPYGYGHHGYHSGHGYGHYGGYGHYSHGSGHYGHASAHHGGGLHYRRH